MPNIWEIRIMSKLVRMVETMSVPSTFCTPLNESEISSKLNESYNRLVNKRHLTENVELKDLITCVQSLRERALNDSDKKVLNDVVVKLSEAGITNGPRIWKFPVARINDKQHPNGNRRVYERKLWENVINNQRQNWEGLCGLADHPIGDTNPGAWKDSSIVWLDMMIDDANKLIWALGSFVGTYGQLAQEIIDAGGRVGFSSSGFGELMSDGMTVNPETYQIERVADIVLNPSQAVYGSAQDDQSRNIEYTRQQAVTESIIDVPNYLNESQSAIKKENEMKVDSVNTEDMPKAETAQDKIREALSEAEIKSFKKYVNVFLEDSNNIKNPIDRLKELQNIMELVESGDIPDLQDKVQERLIAERERLETIVRESVNLTEEFGVNVETFTENAKKVAAKAAYLEDTNKELSEAKEAVEAKANLLTAQTADYEALVEALKARNQAANEKVTSLEASLEEAKLEINKLTVAGSALKEAKENVEKELAAVTEKANLLESEGNQTIEDFTSQIKTLTEANKKLELENKEITMKLATAEKENTKLTESAKKMVADIDASSAKVTELSESSEMTANIIKEQDDKIKALEVKLTEATNAQKELEKSNKAYEEKCAGLQAKVKSIKESEIEELTKKVNALTEASNFTTQKYNLLLEKYAELEANSERKAKVPTPQVVMKEAKITSPTTKIASVISFKEEAQIEEYWRDLCDRYGEAVLPYESKIRGAKTLKEAEKAFLINMSDIDNAAHMAENMYVSPSLNENVKDNVLKTAGFNSEDYATQDANSAFLSRLPKGWK